MSDKCELCGDTYHAEPDPEPGWAGLICPGDNADESAKWEYRQALTDAFAEEVKEQSLRVNQLIDRKDKWYARERTDVTHGELQDDCDKRVPEVQREIVKAEAEATQTLDVDPPHLTVQGVPPTGGIIGRGSLRKTWTKPEDAIMYMHEVERPVVNDPAPHSRPGDRDYW